MGLKPPETPLAPAVIELHIEELVLHGFSSRDRFRIGDAVQKELRRLLGGHGLPAFLGKQLSAESLDAGTFRVAPGAKPQAIGVQLAQSLHHGLSSPKKTLSPKTPAKGARKTR
ncbi:MAG: hypothetical protein WA738_13995 [Candidatus Angelobacter sp.]